ncbi:MAG: methyl-accepting chemotaxis protein, partial [Pseudomonadales bacterium]|nr:methyl-accepting chemotaxis protein [Pseudomonadales bacterium]
TNNYYTEDGIFKTLDQGNDKDGWFYSFLKSGQEFSLDVDVDEASGKLTLFVNYLVGSSQNLGVAGVGINVSALADLINNYKIGESGFVYLTDKVGAVRVHRDVSAIKEGNITTGKGISSVSEALLKPGAFNYAEFQGGDGEVIAASTYIESLGWYLVAEVPKGEIYAALNDGTRNIIISNILIAALFVGIIYFIAKSIVKPIIRTVEMLKDIAHGDGDLTLRLEVESTDEVGQLAEAFNLFVAKLQTLIQKVSNTSVSLVSSINSVENLAEKTSKDVSDQRDRINLLATAMHQMGATIQEIARSANDAASEANNATAQSEKSKSVIDQTIEGIHELSGEMNDASTVIANLAEHTEAIGNILAVIRGISDQTNLLALNAAIEAARAGEQGRGFAVVADEVRTLAKRTHDSTEEINSMIGKLQEGSRQAVGAMDSGRAKTDETVSTVSSASESLNEIIKAVTTISDTTIQVATATEEQSTVVLDIDKNIQYINDATSNTADASDATAASCRDLNRLAEELAEQVCNFKI